MSPEEAREIGFPLEWLPTDLTVEEALVNRCDDCGEIIKKYIDAKWRLKLSPCRCNKCAQSLIDRGVDPIEAKYVT